MNKLIHYSFNAVFYFMTEVVPLLVMFFAGYIVGGS